MRIHQEPQQLAGKITEPCAGTCIPEREETLARQRHCVPRTSTRSPRLHGFPVVRGGATEKRMAPEVAGAWRALREALVDQAQTSLVDGLPDGRQVRVVQGSVHREGEEAQVSGTLCLADFFHLPYAPRTSETCYHSCPKRQGLSSALPLSVWREHPRGSARQAARIAPYLSQHCPWVCRGVSSGAPCPSALSGSWAPWTLASLSGQARSGAVRAEAIQWV